MSSASVMGRVRRLLRDRGQPFSVTATADGQTILFNLPYELISSINPPPTVNVGGTVMTEVEDYTIDYQNGVVQFKTAPASGQVVSILGRYYYLFNDFDIAEFVADGFAWHTSDQDPLPVLDPILGQTPLPAEEEELVALLAVTQGAYDRLIEASEEIDVAVPDGVSIPSHQRFSQILQLIPALESRYNRISAALGVGLNRIYVLNQRRVSLQTNRLIPIFREMEFNQPFSGFAPTVAPVGSLVTITGWNLTGASSVTFGGVPSTAITVVSDNQILAVVPAGALTGQIGVTTPAGTILSTAAFVVGQAPPQIAYGPELVQIPVPPGS